MTTAVQQIPSSQIQQGKEIARGNFGIVYKGVWHSLSVAIKVLQGTPSEEEFLREAAILSPLKHPHIVRLFGVSRMPGYAIVDRKIAQ